jgi:hypothetical protein
MMSSSLGPAAQSIPTSPDSATFAAATYAFPGPTMRSTRGTDWVPSAIAAIAPAPPSAKTRSTPAIAAAASTTAAGAPSACGGDARITSPTRATRAGMAAISTLLGYTARPPGA